MPFDLLADKPSLARLSLVLRNRELWPEGFEWNYRFCPTCAMGLAARLWATPRIPDEHDPPVNWLWWIDDATGLLEFDVGYGIFLGLDGRLGIEIEDITPEHVADAIDAHLVKAEMAKADV